MTDYNLKYNEVNCIGVDWEKKEFSFIYKKHLFVYKQESEIDCSADTDHIRIAINCFLQHINDKMIELVSYVNSAVENLEETMCEADEDERDYYEGQYHAYVDVLQRLTTIG
jgi:hypothetical protein